MTECSRLPIAGRLVTLRSDRIRISWGRGCFRRASFTTGVLAGGCGRRVPLAWLARRPRTALRLPALLLFRRGNLIRADVRLPYRRVVWKRTHRASGVVVRAPRQGPDRPKLA